MVLLLVAIQIVIANLVALGKEAFNKKSDLMRGSLSLHLKKRMVKAFVWSVVLHGSETWTLQKEDTRRLEAFEIWIRRRMMKVPWTEHKTNEEILQIHSSIFISQKRQIRQYYATYISTIKI